MPLPVGRTYVVEAGEGAMTIGDTIDLRDSVDGLKVGGHQASSASMVSIMTSLWFGQLRAEDRVSVKPHASPVLHAINYLLGDLDASYLPTLRAKGGLQSYPSRTKDPDPVDYSTGSVGLGATAPLALFMLGPVVWSFYGSFTNAALTGPNAANPNTLEANRVLSGCSPGWRRWRRSYSSAR